MRYFALKSKSGKVLNWSVMPDFEIWSQVHFEKFKTSEKVYSRHWKKLVCISQSCFHRGVKPGHTVQFESFFIRTLWKGYFLSTVWEQLSEYILPCCCCTPYVKEGLKNVCLFVAINFVSDFADVPAGFESRGKISPLPLQYLFRLFYQLSRSDKVRQKESLNIVTVRV